MEGEMEVEDGARWDFLDWVGHDTSSCIFKLLDDPADLARAAAVSRTWRRFVIDNEFCKTLCHQICPEVATFTRAAVVTRSPPRASESSRDAEARARERDHAVYSYLGGALVSADKPSVDCILRCIAASSTDNFPEETIDNTLDPRDRVGQRASYWSSGGHDDPDAPETLTYRLNSDLCIIDEFKLQPFKAYFQIGDPIYSAKAVRICLGHSKLPPGAESFVTDENENLRAIADEKLIFVWAIPSCRSAVMSPEGVALENWRFSQEVSRRELSRMIALHGLPLALVDYNGFRRFVSTLNPVFKVVSRKAITGDCLKKFQEQKQILQEVFRGTSSRVSLTMDMWTSNQTIGYMCITCHFLDDDWKLHKRVVKFCCMKTPHTGVAMFNEVLKFIQEWNIEDKIFAITLDNASNNNAMVRLLRSNLLEKQMLVGKGRLLHYRCAAHVINLICKAGFEIINPIVHKIRESVKFVLGSTSRKQKFEEIIQQLGITYKRRPNLDIATRWNSTYLMLETCLELRRAFDSLAQQDSEYTYAPSLEEWEKARVVSRFLKTFYDATKVISGSLYPTANLYFHEIWEIKIALDNGLPEAIPELSETIEYMQRKFKRYWKLTWLQISFPVIFDPRFKFGFVEFRLKQAFGSEGESKVASLKKALLDLFMDYAQVSLRNQDATQETAAAEVVTNAGARYADWDQHLSQNASSAIEVPSKLETYLKKSTIPRTDTLDILSWWKSNSVEYPTLSRMARDVLAVPASTVASESAFSIGRRIVSDFRSRLTPKNVEALICLQDWIRASGSSEFHMEGIEDFIELPDQHH